MANERLTLHQVQEMERLALHAWPALEIVESNGWLLRYSEGITRRANSVWPNYVTGNSSLVENLARVEQFYHERGLPALYQICPAMQPTDLDAQLERRGYWADARTLVQSVSLEAMLTQLGAGPSLPVEITTEPSLLWWECYALADDVAPISIAVRKAICSGIRETTAFALVLHEGAAIAVGSVVVEESWAGFFNIATLPDFRRMGAARAILLVLGRWARAHGAEDAYLQVMEKNEAACRLYARLGFETGYFYHYREEPTRDSYARNTSA